MCENQMQRDTVLATDVAGRMEATLTDQWKLSGYSLNEKIEGLRRRRGVSKAAIKMLHYLREQRNKVIHHPRSELKDRPTFERFAEEVLPLIEKSSSPEDLSSMLSKEIERLFADLSSDIVNPDDLDTMASEIMDDLFRPGRS